MKIFFEDGNLSDYAATRIETIFNERVQVLDAAHGVTDTKEYLDCFNSGNPNMVIYTNSILALDNKYAWNGELGVPEVYLRDDGLWTRIDDFTDRELRESHNLAKLYLAGEFDVECDF